MGFEIVENELATNSATRCPCVLLLDTSGSMYGKPIEELNAGIQQFLNDACNDEIAKLSLEVGVVTFASGANVLSEIVPVEGLVIPTLEAGGSTCLGEGLSLAMDSLAARRKLYKKTGTSAYAPWMTLMTDGQPTDSWEETARRLHKVAEAEKLNFLGIGIGDNVDMDTLIEICPPSFPPVKLKGLNFREFFRWLADSLSQVSRSAPNDEIRLGDVSGWAALQSIRA